MHGAVQVGDEATRAELKACVLQRNKRCGLVAYEGATVSANACTAEGNGTAAFRTRDRARMCLTECTSKNDFSGIAVFGGSAAADLTNCELEGSQTGGIRVGAGARVTATGCTILGCREGDGIDAADVGSVAQLYECHVSGNKKYAAVAYDGGTIEAFGCVAEGNGCEGFKATHGGHVKCVKCPDPRARSNDDEVGGEGVSMLDGVSGCVGYKQAVRAVKAEAEDAYRTVMASSVY